MNSRRWLFLVSVLAGALLATFLFRQVGAGLGDDLWVLGRVIVGPEGDVYMDRDGLVLMSGGSSLNTFRVLSDGQAIVTLGGEVDEAAQAYWWARGKDGSNPEALVEVAAITHDGIPHSGTASVSLTLDTSTGRAGVSARKLGLGRTVVELAEQPDDPNTPAVDSDRAILYLRENAYGRAELVVAFDGGPPRVIARQFYKPPE